MWNIVRIKTPRHVDKFATIVVVVKCNTPNLIALDNVDYFLLVLRKTTLEETAYPD